MSVMNFDISSMLLPEVYAHPVSSIELIETHISWVVLTGEFAYKIKKPVDFGFLDFSTLEKRRFFCEQELRLNQRLAADLYLDVVAISATPSHPRISLHEKNKKDDIIEYAVRMRQFPQSAQLDRRLSAGCLKIEQMDAIAEMVAGFHQKINSSDNTKPYGSADVVYQPVAENFAQIKQHMVTEGYDKRLSMIERWCQEKRSRLEDVFNQRKADGFIRECHGDMHLRNLAWLDDKPVAFDCIEFNASLRWIDVISEIAFLVMDLQHRQQPEMAARFLNRYLEVTGDYAGLQLLPFYLSYRAMVRAKVAALSLGQAVSSENETKESVHNFSSYINLAEAYSDRIGTGSEKPVLVIMRGLSASGKSTVSQRLLEVTGAIRIRSDVERKRIFNVSDTGSSRSDINAGIYTVQATQKTYGQLSKLSEVVLRSGYSVIIDAAFLKHKQRKPFKLLAEGLQVDYIIVEVTAPADILRQRITQRKNDVSDADLNVLESQLVNWQPLQSDEVNAAVRIDTGGSFDMADLIRKIQVS